MSKRIILLGPAHPFRGGIADFNECLATEFQRQGFETEIVTFKLQYPRFLFPGKTQFSPDPKPVHLKITQRLNSINPFNWLTVGNYIKNRKPDLLISKFWLPFFGPCLGKVANMARTNGYTIHIPVLDNVVPHEKRIGDKLLTNYFIKSCDGFVSMSRSVEDDLEKFTKNRHRRFIPHPIYDNFGDRVDKKEARKYLNLNLGDKIILFFGLIRKYKGLDLLLKALADERLSDVKLIIAGEYYDSKKEYDKIISDLNLTSRIIQYDHFIPTEEVKYFFGSADLLVQPYHSATQSGISQMAYHFHKPMVVTDVGGLSEIIPNEKVGYVVETNAESVADAIFRFYNENKETEFVANVAIEKERFSWAKMVKGILDLEKEIR